MREKGDDRESERVLRSGIEHAPDDADLRHALGLALVRLDRHGDALEELASAVALAPDRARLRYVYAVALLSTGDEEGARREIRDAVERHPGDPEIQALRVQLGL